MLDQSWYPALARSAAGSPPVSDISAYAHWVLATSRRTGTCAAIRDLPGLPVEAQGGCGAPDFSALIGGDAQAVARVLADRPLPLHRAAAMAVLASALPAPAPGDLHMGNTLMRCADLAARWPTVVLGHFPNPENWRRAGHPVEIIELHPHPGDLAWGSVAADAALAKAHLVIATGQTLANGTWDGIVARTPTARLRVILGPSVPLAPALFDHGADILGGQIVDDAAALHHFCRLGGVGFAKAPAGACRMASIGRPGAHELLESAGNAASVARASVR